MLTILGIGFAYLLLSVAVGILLGCALRHRSGEYPHHPEAPR